MKRKAISDKAANISARRSSIQWANAATAIQSVYRGYMGRQAAKRMGKQVATANTSRRGGSYTKTTTKKKRKKYSKTYEARVGSKKSYAGLTYKRTKPSAYLKMLTQPAVTEDINQFQVMSNPGVSESNKQVITNVLQFLNGSDFIAIQANMYQTALATSAQAPTAFDQSFKLGIDAYTCQFEFVNMVQTQIEVDIYEVISKVTKPSFTDPVTDWQTGLTAQEGANIVTTSLAFKSKPTLSKLFNINWKIIKKTSIVMSPGELHQHTFNFQVNRQIDTQYYQTYGQIRGISGSIFFVSRGSPVDSIRGLTSGNVQPGPVKISGWIKRLFKTRALALLPRNNKYTNNLSAAALTNAYTINEEAGTSTDVIGIANSIA